MDSGTNAGAEHLFCLLTIFSALVSIKNHQSPTLQCHHLNICPPATFHWNTSATVLLLCQNIYFPNISFDGDYIASSDRDEEDAESKSLTEIEAAASAKAKKWKEKVSGTAACCPNNMKTVANTSGMKNHGDRLTSFVS